MLKTSLEHARDQNEHLEKLHRLKDAFVATVSHELRTPLTSIRGYLELVLQGHAGELTDQQRDFLQVADRNSDRLLRLVGDLLFVAQVEAGEFALDLAEVDLGAITKDCVESAMPVALERGQTLTISSDPVPPLRADGPRLAQVFDNLLSNALKFTPARGRVELHLRHDGDSALLEVVDSGPGIPALEQELLFERFFRTPLASEQAVPGTGLGLAISKAIAEAHGGELSVESAEGHGCTFRLRLPLSPATAVSPPLKAAA